MSRDSLDKRAWATRTPFMMPIFYHLFEDPKKVYKLFEMLEKYNLEVVESNKLPFFNLIIKKKHKK